MQINPMLLNETITSLLLALVLGLAGACDPTRSPGVGTRLQASAAPPAREGGVRDEHGLCGAPAEPSLEQRFKGAARIVVGTVERVHATFGRNEHGDNLILSTVTLGVEARLRGDAATTARFTIEGGAVGDLSLEVSDLPALAVGDRGVFALRRTFAGGWVPNRRGAGIMRIAAAEGVGLDRLRRAEEVSR